MGCNPCGAPAVPAPHRRAECVQILQPSGRRFFCLSFPLLARRLRGGRLPRALLPSPGPSSPLATHAPALMATQERALRYCRLGGGCSPPFSARRRHTSALFVCSFHPASSLSLPRFVQCFFPPGRHPLFPRSLFFLGRVLLGDIAHNPRKPAYAVQCRRRIATPKKKTTLTGRFLERKQRLIK